MPEKGMGKRLKGKIKSTDGKYRPTMVKVFLACLGIVLFIGLFYQIRAYAINMKYFMFRPEDLALADPPAWVTDEIQAEIFNVPSLREPFSLLEPDIAKRIGKELERIPWIRHVHAVRKYFPRKLEIEMSLRKPVAWAKHKGVLYLVDADGVRLPRECLADGVRPFSLPVIPRVKGVPPVVGRVWEDKGLEAALAVANLLDYSGNPAAKRVASIEPRIKLGQVDSLVIHTSGDATIIWGKPPFERNSMEQSPEVKMQQLLGLLEFYDERKLSEYEEIDIRYYKTPRARRRILTGNFDD